MNTRPRSRWWLVVAVGAILAALLGVQRYRSEVLREEIRLLGDERRAMDELRARNGRLAEAVPTEEELQRLRADRAAVGRLRDEIERMKARAERAERELAKESGAK